MSGDRHGSCHRVMPSSRAQTALAPFTEQTQMEGCSRTARAAGGIHPVPPVADLLKTATDRTTPPGRGLASESVVRMLEEVGVANPRWVAEQLLARRLGQSRAEMLLEPAPLTEETRIQFLADAAACAAGVPMQYVMGSASFLGREFAVGPGVFIPRPETEGLVEAVLNLTSVRGEPVEPRTFAQRPAQGERFRVLDVGTGSGAIAVTLALERPAWRVTATERSAVALAFARRNAETLGARVEFHSTDFLAGWGPDSFNGIVANLPYLDAAQAGRWPRELSWEPWLAQDGGRRGLEPLERILRDGKTVLAPGGWMALEFGDEQGAWLARRAAELGWREIELLPDLAGKERILLTRREGEWKS